MKSQHQSLLSCLSMFFVLTIGLLQCAYGDEGKSSDSVTQQLNHIDAKVSQARILLQTGNAPTALAQLREVATDSWKVLFSVSGKRNFLTSTDPIPSNGVLGRVAREAANAHYWWGIAARQLDSPDEAITAFARAARLFPGDVSSLDLLSTNIQSALRESLKNGFPESAAPDVLADIAAFADHGQWQLKSALWEVANPIGSTESTFFIYTDGTIKAPDSAPHTAPLYRNIPISQLPAELNSTHILYIYNIPAASYYSGLATLQIKVRYSDPADMKLAAHLGQMMLQAKLINDHFLSRKTAVLTLWLETVGANWPNPPTADSAWEAAAKIDSEADSVMVFRIHEPRTDTEWLRELMHEYGHVAWPSFRTFAPPVEPDANGILSETMTPIWLAENRADDGTNRNLVYPLIQHTALPALETWLKEGEESPLAISDTEQARQYLQGLCVYVDRVYGTKVLSRIITTHASTSKDIIDSLPLALAPEGSIPVYLPGAALDAPISLMSLISKTPVNYPTASNVEFRIYIPEGTSELIIPWTGEGTVSSKSTFGNSSVNPQKLTLDLQGTSGWHKLILQIDGNVTLQNAVFITQ